MSSGSTTTPPHCFNNHGYLSRQQETEKAEKVDFDIRQTEQGHALYNLDW
jgi:hypothetical protein